jgi:hypothetical protein
MQIGVNDNENVTNISKSKLIQKVFENKTKTLLRKKELDKFDEGGSVSEKASNPNQDVWTPYEFLHELLPKIYANQGYAHYVVSDDTADRLYSEIETSQIALKEFITNTLTEEGVESIFHLPVDKYDEIDTRRKAIEAKKIFISESELQAYVLTNTDLKQENYVKKINVKKEDLIEKGLILLDLTNDVKWIYRFQYLSGNIQEKISHMYKHVVEYKQLLTDEQYNRQIELLNKVRNPLVYITKGTQNSIFIHPNSDFASDKDEFRVTTQDLTVLEIYNDASLKQSFIDWLNSGEQVFPTDYQHSLGAKEVIRYYVNAEMPNEDDERVNMNKRQNAQLDGEKLFKKFLNEGLNDACKQRLEAVWNAKYNNLVLPELYKIPVALTLSKFFKNNVPFIPNPTQIQSVQFMRNSGSGLLAYGVGVGKTASSILNVSYSIDNGLSKKPLFVVPNATYEKWIAEVEGEEMVTYNVTYTDDKNKEQTQVFKEKKHAETFSKEVGGKVKEKTVVMKGLLPHLPKVVRLYNLNSQIVRYELKDYTDVELEELSLMDEFKIYLTSISNDYKFDDSTINKKIKSFYDDFELENLNKAYAYYKARFVADFKGKTEAKKGEKQKTIFDFWKKENVNPYIAELPYKLGKLKSFPDGTIFMTTYEGLRNLGAESLLSNERDSINVNTSLYGTIYRELSQGEEIENVKGWVSGQARGLALAESLEDAMFGSVGNPKVYLKELGIDYAVFDESHNFKKVFTMTKGKPSKYSDVNASGLIKREPKKYQLGKGNMSSQALSAYVAVRYIQFNNNNKNVVHLTATPFTNDPIEVYSMLALTNYQALVNAGYRWIEDFYDAFMKIAFELRYTASQKIKREEVLVGYNNAPQMRSLIFFLMDYKNGEDANIKRPDKFMYPSYSRNIETIVPPHHEQKIAFDLIKKYIKGEIGESEMCDAVIDDVDITEMTDEELMILIAREGSDRQKNKWEVAVLPLSTDDRILAEKDATEIIKSNADAEDSNGNDNAVIRVLKGLTYMKQVTLSPYLFSCRKAGGNEPTFRQYVETSPKLLYTLNAIKSNRTFEEQNNLRLSGSVIYMNIGVNPSIAVKQSDGTYKKKTWSEGGFEKIKQYLVKELGYKDSEISIVKGGMSLAEKEKQKNKFLSGESLVMIGSATISTGIDLQNNASSLFVCSFDWNPTDAEQVNGRIHRQGNRFSKVRIVYPMIENSADPIIFQLLQEKTTRIKEIWDKEGRSSELDLSDFNPSDLKKKLITDPEDLVSYWLEENLKELEDESVMLVNRQGIVRNAGDEYEKYESYKMPVRVMLTAIDDYRKDEKRQEGIESTKTKMQEIMMKFMNEPEKLTAEVTKANKDSYDYVKDPEGRYVPIDFSSESDEEVIKRINNWITNSDSWWSKNDDYETITKLNEFISRKYPNAYEGKWVSDEELKSLNDALAKLDEEYDLSGNRIDAFTTEMNDIERKYNYDSSKYSNDSRYSQLEKESQSLLEKRDDMRREITSIRSRIKSLDGGIEIKFNKWGGIADEADNWKRAKIELDKLKDKLEILGIAVDDIQNAKQIIADRILQINVDIDSVVAKQPEMLKLFKQQESERKSTAPSVSERVSEFSSVNAEFLGADEQLVTFKEDVAPVAVDLPKEIITAKVKEPKVKVAPKVEISSEREFLTAQIEAFEMMLEVEDDKKEIKYLKQKIEAFKMLIEMED